MYLADLHAARARAGYSQVELSRRSGVARDAISKIECLRRQAQPSTVRRLAEVLEVDVEDLYGEQPDPAPPVFRELQEALREADTRGGREEQMRVLEEFLQRDPGRLRQWLYEVTLEEIGVGSSFAGRDYSGAAVGAGRAAGKALEIYPLLVLSLLDLVQDLLAREGRVPALPPAEEATGTAPETTPVPRTPSSRESRTEAAAEPEED